MGVSEVELLSEQIKYKSASVYSERNIRSSASNTMILCFVREENKGAGHSSVLRISSIYMTNFTKSLPPRTVLQVQRRETWYQVACISKDKYVNNKP